jgi:hypothetical protein
MKSVLRIAVGVVAVVLVILQLPDVTIAVGSVFCDLPLLVWPGESELALARLMGWLTVVLWLGLAVVSERAGARALAGAAALVQAALNLDEYFMLANVLAVTTVAPEHAESVSGLPGWIFLVPLLFVGAALLVDDGSFKWLGWAAFAALAVDVVREFTPLETSPDGGLRVTALDQALITGRLVAYLALLLGIAYWSFGRVRSGAPSNKRIEQNAVS